jgi:hypothetical protein
MAKIQKPNITDFTDAQHNHTGATSGGAITASVTYASSAEINTGTENAKAINPSGLKGSKYARKSFVIAMS